MGVRIPPLASNKSALRQAQEKTGAVFPSDRTPAAHFGDARAEYEAARSAAAVFDLSDRMQLEITGDDRITFLHNFCTNDIKSLQPGQGCEAFVVNVKGRILGHIFVFSGKESIRLESVAGCEEPLMSHLDRYIITEDVELHNRTNSHGELLVTGPRTSDLVRKLNVAVEQLAVYEHDTSHFNESPLSVRRVDWLGRLGYLLLSPREHLPALWECLIAVGVHPAGCDAFESLRIEACLPLYGTDISEDNLAQEVARTEQAISFSKGCYLGQEPIARLDALGHVNRELCGLRLCSSPAPAPGSPVVTGDGQKEIGTVTSSSVSYRDEKPVALAYLRSKYVQPETQVAVKRSDERVDAVVFRPES